MKLKLINNINILTEVKMNDAELFKPNSATGQPRMEILYDLIQKGEPILLEPKGQITVDKTKSRKFIAALKAGNKDKLREILKDGNKYNDVLFTKDGIGYKITALKKAPYFGGAGGHSGADAQKTAWQESTQSAAIAISIMLNKKIEAEDLTPANIEKAKTHYDVDSSQQNMEEIIINPTWVKSLVNTTNELRKKFKLTGYEVHRGSSWVKKLEDKFNEVNKDEKGRIFSGKDKWNPADIWLVKPGTKLLADINNLKELNAWLQKMFEEEKVVGVSLKLTPKDTKSKIYNFDDDLDDLLNISVTDLLVSRTNNLFRSKEGSIIFEGITPLSQQLEEDNFVVRSFSANTNVNGEISGRYAAGGKIGFGPMNRILRTLKLPELTHRKELIAKLDRSQKKDKVKYYGPLLNDIIRMAGEVNPDVASKAKEDLEKIANEVDFNKISSKYQAVETLSNVKKASKEKQRDFIQQVIQYASSRSDLSSVYIKVW